MSIFSKQILIVMAPAICLMWKLCCPCVARACGKHFENKKKCKITPPCDNECTRQGLENNLLFADLPAAQSQFKKCRKLNAIANSEWSQSQLLYIINQAKSATKCWPSQSHCRKVDDCRIYQNHWCWNYEKN